MMKHLNTLMTTLLLIMASMVGQAAEVTPQTAEQVARNFWNLHHDKDVAALTTPMQRLDVRWDAFYIFAPSSGKGFVIVAADDCVRPVLAYSFHNAAMRDDVGRDMAWWLDGWQQQVDDLRAADLKAEAEVIGQWQQLLTATGSTPVPLTAVSPMVTTQWDQEAPYNDSCPSRSVWGNTVQAVTGCVATAMAQVMKYWNYPEHGTGTHSYYSPSISGYGQGFGDQTANFGATTYDWEHMTNTYSSVSSNVEKAAVATLMYHCGVACDMTYGSAYEGGSGAMIHNIPYMCVGHSLNGMVKYFGYSSEATGMDRIKYDDNAWTAMVRAEIDAARPILYAGGDETSGGHCFVCDGYDNQNRFHFNWGWSGDGDGYYTLDHLAPGSGGAGGGTGTYDFTNLQQMLVGLQPHTGDDSLCVIRQFPYTEDFEVAPTCWESTTSNDSYSYSWMLSDASGVDGIYSACVSACYYGSCNDHLFSPAIVTPGDYKLTWQARAVKSSKPDTYTLNVDTVSFSETLSSTVWAPREVFFSVAEGDTVRLDFGHTSTTSSGGVLIDNIVIETVGTPDPDPDPSGIDVVESLNVNIYPNPTKSMVYISMDAELQRVEVYEMTGRQVLATRSHEVDFTILPAGVYLLRCISADGMNIQRVVKK